MLNDEILKDKTIIMISYDMSSENLRAFDYMINIENCDVKKI